MAPLIIGQRFDVIEFLIALTDFDSGGCILKPSLLHRMISICFWRILVPVFSGTPVSMPLFPTQNGLENPNIGIWKESIAFFAKPKVGRAHLKS